MAGPPSLIERREGGPVSVHPPFQYPFDEVISAMSFKTTYILFGILLVMLVLLGLNQFFGNKPGDELYLLSDLHRSRLEAKDFQTVTIERNRPQPEKLVFVRDEATKDWRMAEPTSARINDQQAINGIITQIKDAQRIELKEDLGSNLEARGLNPPVVKATITAADGKSWSINLGDESFGDPTKRMVYVTTPAKPNDIAAVSRVDLEGLLKVAKEYRTRNLLTPSSLNITEVDLSDAGNKHVLKLKKEGFQEWKFIEPKYGDATFDSGIPDKGPMPKEPRKIGAVKDLLESLEELKVDFKPDAKTDDFVADNVTDLARYGLEKDKPSYLRLQVTYTPGSSLGGDQGAKPITDTLLVGNVLPDDKEKRYARLESENNVVKVPVKPLLAIATVIDNPNILRNRDLVQLTREAIDKVDAIDLRNASGVIKLRKVGNQWKIWEDASKSVPADANVIGDLLTRLAQPRQITDFPPAAKTDSELGLDDKTRAAEVSIWVDGINQDEAKKDEKKEPALKEAKPTVQVAFSKKMPDGLIFARRQVGADVLRASLPDAILEKLEQKKIDFFDKKLTTFANTADITKVVIQQGKDITELEAETKDGKTTWKLKLPAELAGRMAESAKVNNAIDALKFLQPEKFVTEKASPGELKDWKLDPADLKVTLTMKKGEKETEEKVFGFGKTQGETGPRYARQGHSDLIFLVRPNVIDAFTGSFADLQVFDFTPAKVNRIRLAGWKKVEKRTVTLDLKRKGTESGSWEGENLGDFQLDGAKVESLLTQLSKLRAERILVIKKGPQPEHELSEADRTLLIELWVDEGKKDPTLYTLTIGKLVEKPDKGYAAVASTLPGDVLLLKEERFKDLATEGMKYFSK